VSFELGYRRLTLGTPRLPFKGDWLTPQSISSWPSHQPRQFVLVLKAEKSIYPKHIHSSVHATIVYQLSLNASPRKNKIPDYEPLPKGLKLLK
jgi:hypothetical protein